MPFRSHRGMTARMSSLPYPALHASHARHLDRRPPSGTRAVGRGEAIRIAADTPVILLNAPLVGQRLGYADLSGLDLLELFAFLHPARFAVPTPKGLARAVDLSPPTRDEPMSRVPARGGGGAAGGARGRLARARGRVDRGAVAGAAALALGAAWSRDAAGQARRRTNAGCSRGCPNGRSTPPRPAPRTVTIDAARRRRRGWST